MTIISNSGKSIQVEVLDAMFERIGVNIIQISVEEYQDIDIFDILVEMTTTSSKVESFDLCAAIYNKNGSLMSQTSEFESMDGILGYKIENIQVDININMVSKIRFYPTDIIWSE